MYSYLYVGLIVFVVLIYIRDNFGTNQSYNTVNGTKAARDLTSKNVISDVEIEQESEFPTEKGLANITPLFILVFILCCQLFFISNFVFGRMGYLSIFLSLKLFLNCNELL